MDEYLNNEESVITQPEELYEIPLWERVGNLASIYDLEEYTTQAQNVIPFILKELKQVNSETRHLYGKFGDDKPWIINENRILKLYKMVQRLVDLQEGEDGIRIMKKTSSEPVDSYMGILKLKICMAIVQVFSASYRKLLPLEEKYIKFRMDLNYIYNTAVEIEGEIGKSLESIKVRNINGN